MSVVDLVGQRQYKRVVMSNTLFHRFGKSIHYRLCGVCHEEWLVLSLGHVGDERSMGLNWRSTIRTYVVPLGIDY